MTDRNPHKELLEFCKSKKEAAMKMADSNGQFGNSRMAYDASQAVNAWDELAGQLNKPKPVTPKRFEKTKETALRLVALMTNGGFKTETKHEIMALELPTHLN